MRWLEALSLSKGPIGFYRVSGDSMLPTYQDGNLLVGWCWFTPKPGQVVVARTPKRYIVKRIKSIEGDKVWLEGDNAKSSTDSRTHGVYNAEHLEARIVLRLI